MAAEPTIDGTSKPTFLDRVTGEPIDPLLDPDARQIAVDAARGPGLPEEMGAKREAFDAVFADLAGDPEELYSVEGRTIAGPGGELRLRIYRPDEGTLPAIVYTHGGGFEKGGLESHDPPLRHLANRSGCLVVAVEYRLAPEAGYPAQTDDAYAALLWVTENAGEIGVDPGRIALAGDSVGGNLAAVSAIRARDEGGPTVAAQVLFYPVTDVTLSSRSWQRFADGPWLSRDYETNAVNRVYTSDGGVEPTDPRVSPLYADVAGLPPALVIDAEFDGYRDEGQAYASKLREAGVPATGVFYSGMIHDFAMMPGRLGSARAALEQAAAYLRVTFGLALGEEPVRHTGSFGDYDEDPRTPGAQRRHPHDTRVGSFGDHGF